MPSRPPAGRLPSCRRALGALALALLLLASLGCTHAAKRNVHVEGGLTIFLRSQQGWGGTVEKHYNHPITIASVRMAHILSRLDIRRGTEKNREPALPTEILYPAAEGISKALADASPDEVVVVQSVRKTKRLYLFDRSFLTNFLLYARGDQIYIHLSRTDWPIPPRRKEKLPEPEIGKHPMEFKVFPGTAMALVDKQSVVVDWRDPIFRDPTRTKITASGEVVRREVLFESAPEDWPENQPDVAAERYENLSPEQLRQLADVEEQRRNGLITESDYRAERSRILNR